MYHHVSFHCKQCTTGNELEHLGLMVFANALVNFFSLSLSLLSPVSLPCMPQMFSLVAPTDRNLLARRKARSSPGERSTKPPVCTQQMQKASPSATSSLCHMDLRDLIQEGTFFFLRKTKKKIHLPTQVCSIHTESNTNTHLNMADASPKLNS